MSEENGGYARVVRLLGPDTFIVPCEWGTKKPLLTYVERPFASTQSEAYRTLCAQPETNLAVLRIVVAAIIP